MQYSEKSHAKDHQRDLKHSSHYPPKKMNIVNSEKHETYSTKPIEKKIEPHLHLTQRLEATNIDELSIESLYTNFKDLEKCLKPMSEVLISNFDDLFNSKIISNA